MIIIKIESTSSLGVVEHSYRKDCLGLRRHAWSALADGLLPHLLSTGNYAGVCTQYEGGGGGGGVATGKAYFPWRSIPGGGPSNPGRRLLCRGLRVKGGRIGPRGSRDLVDGMLLGYLAQIMSVLGDEHELLDDLPAIIVFCVGVNGFCVSAFCSPPVHIYTLTFKELMPEEFRTHAKRQFASPQELNYSTNSCLSSIADAERCIKQRFVLVVDATREREEEEIRCSMEREGRRNTAACFYRCQTGESKRVSEVESEKVKTARVARPGLNQ
ncbi:hypothetical protein BHE74_00058043 [Ensete ventricosum]|nr:hypothetical protein BHE74_00058043 [Ensete ventricosum]